MENNQVPIKSMLESFGVDPKGCDKEQIIDFSVSYGNKLIKKCLEQKANLGANKKIKPEDVRQAYENMKMIRSPELAEKQQQRQKRIIESTKKMMLEQEQPNKVNTVKLHFQNNLEHMMTNKEYQLTFQ